MAARIGLKLKIMIKTFFQNHKLAVVFFTIYFIVGCLIFSDYGSGWDEEAQRITNGKANVDYVVTGNVENITQYGDLYHGPIWEMILYSAEVVLKVKTPANIYALRHFLNFSLFFISLIFLYFTLIKLNINKTLCYLGCLFYILMPRVFEDAFINSKDTTFLSVITISYYFLFSWMEKKNYKALILYSIVCAFAIAIRITAVIIPVFSILIYFIQSKSKADGLIKASVYLISTYTFMVLFWPFLWAKPIQHFIDAFSSMKKFGWGGMNFYFGKQVWAMDLPWHYLPSWFIISTPIFLTLIFLLSVFIILAVVIKQLVKYKKIDFFASFYLYMLALFFSPFVMVILFNSCVYDGWRHVFFVASPFILCIVIGLSFLFNTEFFKRKAIKNASYITLFLCASYLLYWNIKNHPYQNVYFNTLITNNYDVRQSFELDYWGVSYKQGLEKLIKLDKSDTLIYSASNYPGYQALYAVRTKKTILFVDSVHKANYYLSNYRWHSIDFEYKKIDSIMVDGFEIMGIYKVR